MIADQYKISVELTKSEIASYNFHHIRWLLFLDAVGFALLLIAVYYSLYSPNPETRNTLGVVIFWGVLFLAVGLSQPFILFMQIFVLKSPDVAEQMRPKSYTFDDTGIHVEAGLKRAIMPWSGVVAIKDIGKLFIIYTSPKLAYIIPKRYFPSRQEMHHFIGHLLAKVKEASGQAIGRAK